MKIGHKRRLGQHFLRDTGVLERIIEVMAPAENDLVLEVGAGDGALSHLLCPRVGNLIAVEIDPDCAAPLADRLAGCSSARIVQEDILQLDTEKLIGSHLREKQSFRVAGNLPYNIGSAIIQSFLQHDPLPRDMTFMLQLEVARRIVARPGTREYGFFSVLCQFLSEPRLQFRVSPGCFSPPPRVHSALVTLRCRKETRIELRQPLITLAKAAFGHRRKTLANALRRHPALGPRVEEILGRSGIDGRRRAEQLSLAEYTEMAVALVAINRKAMPAR